MTHREERLWRALSDLHTLCLFATFPDPLTSEPAMRAAQASLAACAPEKEDDILRTLHWPWGESGKAWVATKTWLDYRRKIGKSIRDHRSIQLALKKFESYGEDAYCRAIDESVMSGWQGLFLPKEDKRPKGIGMSSEELRKIGVRK